MHARNHRDPSSVPSHGENSQPSADLSNSISPYSSATPRGVVQPRRLTPHDVLHLQRTLGNQATNRVLRQARPARTVQRDIENETYGKDVSESDKGKASAFFQAFNIAVQNAYKYVLSVPSILPFKDLNGYTQLWCEKWESFVGGGRPQLMAATFGYVIESLVSNDTTTFWPAAPSGCTIYTQVVSGGTRPDLVLRLKEGGRDVAWLDLTASASADHIFDKEGWDKKIGIFAEVTYPSLDPGSLALMKQNKDNLGDIDPEEFKKRVEAAKALYFKRKAAWWKMGAEKYSARILKTKFKSWLRGKGYSTKGLNIVLEIHPELKRQFIKIELEKGFDTTIEDEKMIPSILSALGISPSTWNFDTGYNSSERAGEAWLVDNDPTIEVEEAEIEEAEGEGEVEEVGEGSKEEEGEIVKHKGGGKAESSMVKKRKKNRGKVY